MLILASASPRRKELLENLGYKFDCLAAYTDETLARGIDGYNAVYELAYRKAKTVAEIKPDGVILASDTVVFCDGEILGKPNDRTDAENMLRRLSGKKHTVYTGVCVMGGDKCERLVSAAEVEFYPLDDALIEWYLDTGEPYDKAGAYGIQGKGSVLVKKIDGDYFTVMGLPCAEVFRALKKFQILPE